MTHPGRALPPLNQLLQRDGVRRLGRVLRREVVAALAREALAHERSFLSRGQGLQARYGEDPPSRALLEQVIATLVPRWRLHLAGLRRAERLRHLQQLHGRYARVVSAIGEQDGESARHAMRELLASRSPASTPNTHLPG